MLDSPAIVTQFPILQRRVHGQRLSYLDNAATTQKPQRVLDALVEYYSQHNANVHRGVHTLSDESTQVFLDAHEKVAAFFGATSAQLLFTRNTTEAMNHLAWGWRTNLNPGDVVVTTLQDHHSSLVPWQQVATDRQARVVTWPVTTDGSLDLEAGLTLLKEHLQSLRVIVLPHVSNVIGSVTPIDEIVAWLRDHNLRDKVLVVLDAAQSAPHLPIDFTELRIDALVFSGHKLYGPMGSGGAIVSLHLLKKLTPVLTGGGMIDTVTSQTASFSEDPVDRFTAGTPDVASLVGLAAAFEWFQAIGWDAIQEHEHNLLQYAWQKLSENPRVDLIGPAVTVSPHSRVGSVSWLYEGAHAHDVAQILDRAGVAVRSGHHCTMPFHAAMQWQATCRASVAVYNTRQDIDQLCAGLLEVDKVFRTRS